MQPVHPVYSKVRLEQLLLRYLVPPPKRIAGLDVGTARSDHQSHRISSSYGDTSNSPSSLEYGWGPWRVTDRET